MRITDELRSWASIEVPYKYGNQLTAIADRIDAEHERRCNEQYACGAEDGISVSIEALVIQTHGFIELSKDADGEYIHIGDVMENLREDLEPKLHHTFRVYSIQYRDYEQVCTLTEDGYPTILYRANECRHYHTPTVEDVLREFGDWYAHTKGGCDEDGIIADYAKRLKLAEGEGE